MADGGSAIKQFTGEVTQATSEVAKDVKDSVGQAIEQGVQSVVGTQLTPQQTQPFDTEQSRSTRGRQKQLEDQKKLAEARRKIKWYQDLATAQKAVREKEKQNKMQKQQMEMQEQQAKQAKQTQPFDTEQSRSTRGRQKQSIPQPGQPEADLLREDLARTQMERSKGRGVGG